MSLMVRTTLGLLSVFLIFTGCGFNPKDSGGGLPGIVEKGTVECLYAGCHDSTTATTGINPDVSWALGFHGNVDAVSASITGTCTDCHDPINDSSDYSLLFTANSTGIIADSIHSALGLTYKPIIGCEACHGAGMEHYAYIDTTLYYGEHREPMDSTAFNVFANPFHLLSCGPCHSPSQHAGGTSVGDFLTNQYPEWFRGDGPGFFVNDGHSDSLVVETLQGFMTSTVRGVPCAACHTTEGFVTFFAIADTSWATSQAVIDRLISETGDTDIEDPSNLPGSAALSQVSCVSCHPSHDPDNLLRLNKLDYSGAVGDTVRRATLCTTCHNVRGLLADVGSGQADTGGLEIPRHPQKEMFEGVKNSANDSLRGVESLPGFIGSDSIHAGTDNIPDACTGCHYLVVANESLVELPLKATTGHTFLPRLENCLAVCHSIDDFLLSDGTAASFEDTTIASFDFGSIYYSVSGHPGMDYDGDTIVEPLQTEILDMLTNLRNALTDAGVPFDESLGLFDLTQMASKTTTERAAAYNYDFVVGDRSLGYHNPIYVVNLLAASISALP